MKTPGWLRIAEALLIVVGVLLVAYMLRMRVLPLGPVEQPRPRITSPEEQVFDYYVSYPERYIRIGDESWQYDQGSRSAFHSFTLTNKATIGYRAIRIRLLYRSRGGKDLETRSVNLPGALAPLGSMSVSRMKVRDVPAASDTVLLKVEGAEIDKPAPSAR